MMPSFSVFKGIMEDGAKRCNPILLDHSLHLLGKIAAAITVLITAVYSPLNFPVFSAGELISLTD